MELELLDQLLASDEPLRLAGLIFEIEDQPANIDKARHAIVRQVQAGLLQVLFKSDLLDRVLEDWEIRQVLEEKENWLSLSTETNYFLRITPEGAKLIS